VRRTLRGLAPTHNPHPGACPSRVAAAKYHDSRRLAAATTTAPATQPRDPLPHPTRAGGTPRPHPRRPARPLDHVYLSAAMTGLRRGELLALRWQDVDLELRRRPCSPHLQPRRVRRPEDPSLEPRRPPRRPRPRPTPSAPRALLVPGRKLDVVFCHPTSGRVLDPSRVRKQLLAVAQRAGLQPVRFRDLRLSPTGCLEILEPGETAPIVVRRGRLSVTPDARAAPDWQSYR
jgi:integrase